MSLFRPPEDEVLDRLRNLDLDHMTPLQALNLLASFKIKVSDET